MIADYRLMLKQLRGLAVEILPPSSPTGSYTTGETLRILAFRLFAHAEIESFLELCAETLRVRYATRNSNGVLSRPAAYRIVWAGQWAEKFPPRGITQLPPNVQKVVNGILNQQQNVIQNNQGVSEKDVLKLLIPLGFDVSFFDHAWLRSMSALARARGEAAHSSAMNVGFAQPTPEAERALLLPPLRGLARVAVEVERLETLA